MNLLDILILAVIAVALVFAWRAARRHKGGCGSCSGNCSECRKVCDMKERRKEK